MPLTAAAKATLEKQIRNITLASTRARAVVEEKAQWPDSRSYKDAKSNYGRLLNMLHGLKQQLSEDGTAELQDQKPIRHMPEPSAPPLSELQDEFLSTAQMLADARAAMAQPQPSDVQSDAWLNQQYQHIMAPSAPPAPKLQQTVVPVTVSAVPAAPLMSMPSSASASTSLPPLQTSSDVQRQYAQTTTTTSLAADPKLTVVAVTPNLQIVFAPEGGVLDVRADVIVNAANKNLREGKGVCGAIYAAVKKQPSGEQHVASVNGQLQWALRDGSVPDGTVVFTKSFLPRSSFIAHAVGPKGIQPDVLADTYREILNRCFFPPMSHSKPDALPRKVLSVAIPCISAGIYGYPVEQSVHVVKATVMEWLKRHRDHLEDILISLVTFTHDEHHVYTQAFLAADTVQPATASEAATVVLAASSTPAADSRAASVVSRNSNASRAEFYTYLLDLAHEQSVLDAFKQAVQSSTVAAALGSSAVPSTSGKPKAATAVMHSIDPDGGSIDKGDAAFLRHLVGFNKLTSQGKVGHYEQQRMLTIVARSQAIINRHATDPLYASELKKFKVWMHAQTAKQPRKPELKSAVTAAPILKSTTGGKMKHAALASAATHGGWKATRARHAANAELAW